MQSLQRSFRSISHVAGSNITQFRSSKVRLECESRTFMNFLQLSTGYSKNHPYELPDKNHSCNFPMSDNTMHIHRELTPSHNMIFPFSFVGANSPFRCITTVGHPEGSFEQDSSSTSSKPDQPQRIKFKRLSKTAKHIMNILDKEAVEKVQAHREIPDIRPGYIIQLKVEVPENKRRISMIKGIVIARRNAGLNTTFRLRRLVAGVGVESVFPLYSPNIKEMKVLDKKKVRRAKLYYLRNRMNPLKK